MIVTISEAEWRIVLRRARDIGRAMGAERAAVLGARAGLEALGCTVPVIEDEIEDPAPVTLNRSVDDPRAGEQASEGPRPSPTRDLRVSARTAVDPDGYCDACEAIHPAAALGVSTSEVRLCPIHGIATRTVIEVAEGRFELGTLPGERLARGLDDGTECGAPIGGVECRLNAGHEGRHDPRRAMTVDTDEDDNAPYPHEDFPA